MRVRLLVLLLPILLLVGYAARSEETQEEIFEAMRERLQPTSVLRAAFRQERSLQILQRPLVSSGTMILVEGEGILWRVEDPHRITYLIRAGEALEWEGEGGPRRVGMAAAPAFRVMTEMFLGALTGDLDTLQRSFVAQTLPAQQGWRVSLTPRSGDLAEIVSRLEVAGDRYVREVHLREVRGDAVSFTFSGFHAEPSSLNASEKHYFAQ